MKPNKFLNEVLLPPDIFINKDSSVWDKMDEDKPVTRKRSSSTPTIAVDDDNKVVDILLKWWNEKYGLVEGNRNNNLFIFTAISMTSS